MSAFVLVNLRVMSVYVLTGIHSCKLNRKQEAEGKRKQKLKSLLLVNYIISTVIDIESKYFCFYRCESGTKAHRGDCLFIRLK